MHDTKIFWNENTEMHTNISIYLLLDGKADIEVQGESGGILLWHLTVFSLFTAL